MTGLHSNSIRGKVYCMGTYIIKKVQLRPSLLMTGAFTFHSSKRVNRIEEAARPEIRPHFLNVISKALFVPMTTCKMKMFTNEICMEDN